MYSVKPDPIPPAWALPAGILLAECLYRWRYSGSFTFALGYAAILLAAGIICGAVLLLGVDAWRRVRPRSRVQ